MTTYQRTRRDAKRAGRELKKGDTFYVVLDVARNVAPYEDGRLCSAYTVTGDHPLLGGAMVGGQAVEGLCMRSGPLYTSPPRGMRNVATPGPQVGGPLGNGDYEGVLDEAELRGLEKQVAQSDSEKRRSTWRI